MKIMQLLGKYFAVLAVSLVLSLSAIAQDDDEGPVTQGDDAKYLSITHVKFKAGQRESAMEIIAEHFVAAGAKAGTPGPILAIHYQTGKWDAAYIWEMAGGMADLEWYRSANDIKWFEALSELEGGADKAAELLQDFDSKIASAMTEVGHHHVPADE
ncbi:MAG: hypothetical protein ACR2QR_00835 [Woeseiaceae bacterium]